MAAWVFRVFNRGEAKVSGTTAKGYVILNDGFLDKRTVHRFDRTNNKKGEKAKDGYHTSDDPSKAKPGDVLSLKGLSFTGASGDFDFPAIYFNAFDGNPAGFYYRNPDPTRGNGDWEATEDGEPIALDEK